MGKYLPYITAFLVLVTVVVVFLVLKDELKKLAGKVMASNNTAQPTTTALPPATQSNGNLDFNRLLKRGVTGAEVQLLQSLLGVEADGIFGPVTEGALEARKGVKQITLADWDKPVTSQADQDLAKGFSNYWSYLFGL